MQADLGIAPSNDRDGCLQDAHWYSGYIGGRFQSYAIGNILSAQFYGAALKAHPSIPHELAKGEFGTLHTWLRDNLYRHGSKFAPNDIVERATGAVMQVRRFIGCLPKLIKVVWLSAARSLTDSALGTICCDAI
jgi:carboxypeptidase Taq